MCRSMSKTPKTPQEKISAKDRSITVAEVYTEGRGDLEEVRPKEAKEVVFIEPQLISKQVKAIRMKLREKVIHSTQTIGEATMIQTTGVVRAASVEAKESTEVGAQMSGEAKAKESTEAEAQKSGEDATNLKITCGIEARGK